jgi:hypothetical protein
MPIPNKGKSTEAPNTMLKMDKEKGNAKELRRGTDETDNPEANHLASSPPRTLKAPKRSQTSPNTNPLRQTLESHLATPYGRRFRVDAERQWRNHLQAYIDELDNDVRYRKDLIMKRRNDLLFLKKLDWAESLTTLYENTRLNMLRRHFRPEHVFQIREGAEGKYTKSRLEAVRFEVDMDAKPRKMFTGRLVTSKEGEEPVTTGPGPGMLLDALEPDAEKDVSGSVQGDTKDGKDQDAEWLRLVRDGGVEGLEKDYELYKLIWPELAELED